MYQRSYKHQTESVSTPKNQDCYQDGYLTVIKTEMLLIQLKRKKKSSHILKESSFFQIMWMYLFLVQKQCQTQQHPAMKHREKLQFLCIFTKLNSVVF